MMEITVEPTPDGGFLVAGKLYVGGTGGNKGRVFRVGETSAGQSLTSGGVEAAKRLIIGGKV